VFRNTDVDGPDPNVNNCSYELSEACDNGSEWLYQIWDADYNDSQIVPDRDIFWKDITVTFDGTSGVGWGTLASRPSTCTTNPSGESLTSGWGPGYWATDQGSWNTSASNPEGVNAGGADGVLYVCTATNTWTVKYTPYTYPHPLRGESGESGESGGASVVMFIEWASFIIACWHLQRMAVRHAVLTIAIQSAKVAHARTKALAYESAVKVLTHLNERMKR
jgi:hypothetical protein